MKEIWKDIKDYEGLYQVSNLGRVKSLDRIIKYGDNFIRRKGKILNIHVGNHGYCVIDLSKHNNKKTFLVHKLVAETYIPNTNNYKCINHKDENKQNNCVSNLEWCSYSYNINYGTRKDRDISSRTKKVIQKDKLGNLIRKWKSTKEIVENNKNFTKSSINKCCRGELKTYKNYIWEYE